MRMTRKRGERGRKGGWREGRREGDNREREGGRERERGSEGEREIRERGREGDKGEGEKQRKEIRSMTRMKSILKFGDRWCSCYNCRLL